ncbi:AAA domain (dynein-related subfamily) [Prevotella sp. khp1]|uniref:AAA family ATPase n=1 Tax=Prevotellaceae TaxID=171552 RepID=UPI00088C9FD0|nr:MULTISPECIES: AAA family ATPase [Prevotellaceae]QVJ81289.1 AAA family ATPase [Xylanibacter ruminicola]SDQ04681.1 AAA domain (dynein-related subfamily) [Prevotella sp. khp1]
MVTDNHTKNAQAQSNPKEIQLFNKFVDTFIVNRTSLIDTQKQFNDQDIASCLEKLKDLRRMNKKDGNDNESLEYVLEKENTQSRIYELLWHCYYIMYLMGETANTFFEKTVDNRDLFVEKGKGVASTNQAYNKEAIRPFRTLLGIFKKLWNNENKEIGLVKKTIVNLLPKTLNDQNAEIDDRIKNILLYLCVPDKYVPIVSQDHKRNIWNNLCFLVGKEKNGYNEDGFIELLGEIKKIKNVGDDEKKKEADNLHGFYYKSIRPFWDTPKMSTKADDEGGLPLKTLLTFKKAIVLYGPPGTSKTYTARELAKNVISAAFAENLKKEKEKKQELFTKFIEKENQIFGETENHQEGQPLSHIHRLQLHPNYTYDDFIIGKTIENHGVTTKLGYLLRLIKDISEDKSEFKKLPHIVILDEINRVDISRVFGELFTAMEPGYRKEGVELFLTENDTQPQRLKVPENMYFIGTMNMIDFSLEQVDFALRRRFAWVESNYDDGRLKDIIDYKITQEGLDGSIKDEDVRSYINRCTSLNNLISKENSLGDAYKIGHAFFAEIVDIYKEIGATDKWNASIEFLWHISVKPTITAYCGSMDSNMVEDFIKKCHDVFKKTDKL